MKIVHITTTSPFSEKYAYQENLLAHYHKKMGHEVTIITSIYSSVALDQRESTGDSLLDDGTKVIRLPLLFNSKVAYEHLYLVKGLYNILEREKPDLVFAHGIGSLNYKCLNKIKRKYPSINIVMDNHADYINSLHSPITKFLHKIIYRYYLVYPLIKSVNWFYGVTPSRCVFLRDVYGVPEDKIKLLVMGADDEKMFEDKREQLKYEVRSCYNIKDNDFLLVTGGKIDKLKNIHVLAHAVNNLNRKDVKLIVFGKINEDVKPLFEKEISEQVITIGWVNSDKVYKYFYAADLVIFPGLHSVLWEQAIASKVPCAFSKMEGFEHLCVNNNCILMTGKDSCYYESLITNLLNNPLKYTTLKENARSPLLEQFYYSRIALQVLKDCGMNQ